MNGPVTHDPNAEAIIVGASVLSPVAADYAATLITTEDFYRPEHATVWDIVRRLRRSRIVTDEASVRSAMIADGRDPHILIDLCSGVPSTERESVAHFAGIVRGYATRRRVVHAARQAIQRAENPDTQHQTLASWAATEMARVRDTGDTEDLDIETLDEVLAGEDDPYDWIIPGLLERGDRLILTGAEGGGKSTLLRQLGLCAAAGVHPFRWHRIPPAKVALIDAENSRKQFRRAARSQVGYLRHLDHEPADRFYARFPGRIDMTTDRDLANTHKLIDALQPDILIIGPLYKLVPKAIQTDDDAAPLITALDTIRDRGVTLVMEAHAGHALGAGGERNLRPRGSSALLGWPEFGYGISLDPESDQRILTRWRGDRDERAWPRYLEPIHEGLMYRAIDTSDNPIPDHLRSVS